MKFSKCRIKSNPGENAIKATSGITAGAAAASGSALAWFGTAGTVTKIGLALGFVSPPIARFAACGVGGAAIGAAFVRRQLRKPDETWAEETLNRRSV
jgi:hypothetical protein